MPEEFKPGCKRPVINKTAPASESIDVPEKEAERKMLTVGKPAPDFTASGFYQGKFLNFKLSGYKGKWVLLCFYPGDFTFV